MANITIRIEDLRNADSGLKEIISSLNNLHERISQITCDLNDNWDGVACDEYVNRLTKQNNDLLKVITILEEFDKYAVESAAVFESLDEIFKRLVALMVGGIGKS
ncbi:MAG: hypothetical protein VZR27_08325 [Acutalibacteraceae bacterium]|nr:hypothetical protein [Acutalibacteraceae bacterium]